MNNLVTGNKTEEVIENLLIKAKNLMYLLSTLQYFRIPTPNTPQTL